MELLLTSVATFKDLAQTVMIVQMPSNTDQDFCLLRSFCTFVQSFDTPNTVLHTYKDIVAPGFEAKW